ncbi:MAG: hypothetical protein HQK82_15410, partial [Desulfovibrionaceae bacterium]|nr:hypothetical protein [Desulfovibrionaceae bacterium]
IAALPGVSVRHVPFYSKINMLSVYFLHRNLAAISAVHDGFSGPAMAARLLRDAFKHLCAFNYTQMHWQVAGVNDFLRGPDNLAQTDVSALRARDEAFAKKWDIAPRPVVADTAARPFDTEPSAGFARGLLRALTLGGHLVPAALLDAKPSLYVTHRVGQWRANFGHTRSHCLNRGVHSCQGLPMRRLLGLALFARALVCAWRLALGFWKIRRVWRERAGEMASAASWRSLLGLEKD